jgi:hypothetical protein
MSTSRGHPRKPSTSPASLTHGSPCTASHSSSPSARVRAHSPSFSPKLPATRRSHTAPAVPRSLTIVVTAIGTDTPNTLSLTLAPRRSPSRSST